MIQALIGPVAGLLDKFIEDKDQKNALAHEIATLATRQAHEAAMGQIDINKAEAAHRSVFVGGLETLSGLGPSLCHDMALRFGSYDYFWFCVCWHGGTQFTSF